MAASKISALSTESINLLSSLHNALREKNMNKESKLFIQCQEYFSNRSQITWLITKDAMDKLKLGKVISSSTIKMRSSASCFLQIQPHPRSFYLSVHFKSLPKFTFLEIDISILEKDGSICFAKTFSSNKDIGLYKVGVSNACFFRNENPKIWCSIKFSSESRSCVNDKSIYRISDIVPGVNYASLILDNGDYSDLILETEKHKIICHKFILASESPAMSILLKTMNRRIIEMPDKKFKVVKDLVTFIYTGKINLVNFNHVCALYIAADEFGVLKLKDVCSVLLGNSLTETNIAYLLELATLYKDQFLIETSLKFIKDHDIKSLKENFMNKFMSEKC